MTTKILVDALERIRFGECNCRRCPELCNCASNMASEALKQFSDAAPPVAEGVEEREVDVSGPLLCRIAEARQRAEAAEQRVKWQPIETVPQDEFVLLFWPYWSSMPVIGRLWGGRWDCSCALSDGEPPTHWMPLPTTPPADGESAQSS